jgi:hypothetical protein
MTSAGQPSEYKCNNAIEGQYCNNVIQDNCNVRKDETDMGQHIRCTSLKLKRKEYLQMPVKINK